MRRPEWRRRPGNPKGLLGWWWQGFRTAGWPLPLLTGLAIGVGIVFGSVVASEIATLALVVANVLRMMAGRPDPLHALLPDPAPEGQFRAPVEYRKDGIVTGRDEMALTSVGGWLVGEGVRSEFSLRSEDVERLRYRRRFGHSVLTLTDGTQVIVFGRASGTHQYLIHWRIGDERPEGEPTFPPAQAHPQEVARWTAWAVAGGISIFLPNLVASLLHSGSRYAEVKDTLMLLGLSALIWGWSRLGCLVAISTEAMRHDASAGQASPPKANAVTCGAFITGILPDLDPEARAHETAKRS